MRFIDILKYDWLMIMSVRWRQLPCLSCDFLVYKEILVSLEAWVLISFLVSFRLRIFIIPLIIIKLEAEIIR